MPKPKPLPHIPHGDKIPPPDEAFTHAAPDESARVDGVYRQWQGHSRRITLARRYLPGAIIGVFILLFGWTLGRTLLSNLKGFSTEIGLQVADNPHYLGRDAKGHSYSIKGLRAEKRYNDDVVRIFKPHLHQTDADIDPIDVIASDGYFNQTTQRLVLKGDVVMHTGKSGFVIKTPEALYNANTNVLSGTKGVSGTGPNGTFTAVSFVVYDDGKKIQLHGAGDTQVHIVQYPNPAVKK